MEAPSVTQNSEDRRQEEDQKFEAILSYRVNLGQATRDLCVCVGVGGVWNSRGHFSSG